MLHYFYYIFLMILYYNVYIFSEIILYLTWDGQMQAKHREEIDEDTNRFGSKIK